MNKKEQLNDIVGVREYWQKIRKKGEKIAKKYNIKTEADVQRICDEIRYGKNKS